MKAYSWGKQEYLSCVQVLFEPECSVRMGFHMSFQFVFGVESLEADGAWQLLLLPLAPGLTIHSTIFYTLLRKDSAVSVIHAKGFLETFTDFSASISRHNLYVYISMNYSVHKRQKSNPFTGWLISLFSIITMTGFLLGKNSRGAFPFTR